MSRPGRALGAGHSGLTEPGRRLESVRLGFQHLNRYGSPATGMTPAMRIQVAQVHRFVTVRRAVGPVEHQQAPEKQKARGCLDEY
jgi:hypothetical protein